MVIDQRSMVIVNGGAKMGRGDVAQLGERRPCKAEAVGSNPIISIAALVANRLAGLAVQSAI